MKYELNEAQVDLILRGLDALTEAAESENRCSNNKDIREGNNCTIKDTEELRTYLATKGEYIQNGKHYFKLVDAAPLGYVIWNIGKNMVDGYLPFCRLKAVQPFPGGREIESDTLRAIKCEGAQTILAAIGYGPETIEQMMAFVENHEDAEVGSYYHMVSEKMKKAIPYMQMIKWN